MSGKSSGEGHDGGWVPLSHKGLAIHFFTAGGNYQVSLNIGDLVQIEEHTEDWYKGYLITSKGTMVQKRRGIFPKIYVKLLDPGTSPAAIAIDQDVILNQIYQVVEEWGGRFKSLYRDNRMGQFNSLKERVTLLLEMRRQILSPTTPNEVRDALKNKAVSKIDELRNLMGTDITVHTLTGQIADEANTGVIALYHLHLQYDEKEKKKNKTPMVRIVNVGAAPAPAKGMHMSSQSSLPLKAKKKDDQWRKTVALARQQTIGAKGDAPGLDGLASPTPTPNGAGYNSLLDTGAGAKGAEVVQHILMDMKVLMVVVGDNTEMYFSLFNAATSRFISEEYQVQMTGQGMPTDLGKLGKLKTIFTNLTSRDITPDLYLVLRLVRRGNMALDASGKKGPGAANFRRPHACAVLPLVAKFGDAVLVPNKEVEHTIKVYVPNQESNFATIHESIIKNNFQGGKTAPFMEIPNSKGVCLGLTLLQGDLAVLGERTPELAEITRSERTEIPDFAPPLYQRHELYLTLDMAELVKDKSASVKNCQVVFSLRNGETGEAIRDCLSIGRGEGRVSEVESIVMQHTNTPHWNETFIVSLPHPTPGELDQFKSIILVAQLYHCQEKGTGREEFGQGFLKLSKDDGSVLDDAVHTLFTFKPNVSRDPFFFLKEEGKLHVRKGESIKVRSQLTSTCVTSNTYVYQLLRWKRGGGDGSSPLIEEALKRFTFIVPAEITNFLKEILDSIFELMIARPQESSTTLLGYDAIVFVINLLMDERTKGRYTRLGPVLDLYISSTFRSKDAHKRLIACLKLYLQDPSNLSKIINTFKALAYLFKFIIASRLEFNLQSKRSSGVPVSGADIGEDDTFKTDLLDVFKLFNDLMRNPAPTLRGPQASALKNISSIFPDLSKIFNPVELAGIITRFVEAIQYSPQLELLNKEKLLLINRIVCSPIFLENTARGHLMPTLLAQLSTHLRSSHHLEILQSILILCVMLNAFQTKIRDPAGYAGVLTLFPHVSYAVKVLRDDTENYSEPVMCLLALLKLTPSEQLEKYLDSVEKAGRGSENKKTTFLIELFNLLQHIMCAPRGSASTSAGTIAPLAHSTPSTSSVTSPPQSPPTNGATPPPPPPPMPAANFANFSSFSLNTNTPFSERWVILNMFAYGAVLKFTSHMASYLTAAYRKPGSNIDFSSPETPDYRLWAALFSTALTFMKIGQLGLEDFPANRRNLVHERYGDMRREMASLLHRLWTSLSNAHKLCFLPLLVGPAIQLMMLAPPFVKDLGVDLYYNLFEVEMSETNATRVVEAQTIDTLDTAAYEASLPPNFNTFFVSKLGERFAGRKTQDECARKGSKFLADITYLLELLMALSVLPTTPQYEEDRIVAIVKLMDYLHQTERYDSYLKYVHMLESIHTAGGNFGEAGFTVLLHAALLEWDDTPVAPIGMFGRDTARARKDKLYHQAIDYFDKGKLWEEAIKLIKLLRQQYEHRTYDYTKLADLLELQAGLVKKIIAVNRFFPNYFRVAYYGKGFDSKYFCKEFVYRGYELENRPEFVQRLQTRFPSANILVHTNVPTEDIQKGEGQHIQVFQVNPATQEERDGLERHVNADMPATIASYYQTNILNVFLYSKPFRKTNEKVVNEFKDLWVRDTFYSTSLTLPGIHRRAEIIKVDIVEQSPIHNAINALDKKKTEIHDNIKKYGAVNLPADVNTSPFTMLMKGIIDAAVNGGLVVYRDLFLQPAYLKENPDHGREVDKLRVLLREHISMMERGLVLHGRVSGPQMVSLHDLMEVQFKDMKADFTAKAPEIFK
eukprot:TRINITY_DN1660_c0_g1_i2.p1 TRINITY_DN1660_c0_g1~~TRINITY_DN1660_c0_g1_i2.p1  ORF type:complete len:1788 (-),score=598.32 TRINITY_DN1660_c0_g1_i2:101-5464(-)